tara:strand:- start:254 stop:418 length:165 start_codon:yes stop_codon:yes gene_type:complete
MSLKPIGFTPDGSHINKGAIALIVFILIGAYCTFSPAPFGVEKSPVVEFVVLEK